MVLRGEVVQLQASLDRTGKANELLQAELNQLRDR